VFIRVTPLLVRGSDRAIILKAKFTDETANGGQVAYRPPRSRAPGLTQCGISRDSVVPAPGGWDRIARYCAHRSRFPGPQIAWLAGEHLYRPFVPRRLTGL
jgi:hypothetical protein